MVGGLCYGILVCGERGGVLWIVGLVVVYFLYDLLVGGGEW